MYSVLIADDEPLMREALKIMISKIDGFKVLYLVATGEEAVEICKNNKIDLVFMDIMMPGEGGIEASKRIYNHDSNISIYIVSSYNSFDFAIRALKSKVREYISKPVSFLEIKKLLEVYKKENYHKNNLDILENIQLNKLISSINEKDFKSTYYEIPKIVDEIYELENNNVIYIKEKFKEIGQELIDLCKLFDEKNINVTNVFPINDMLIKNKKYYEFWINNIINYVFEENAIRKYSLLKSVFEYIDTHIEEEIGLNEIINNCSLSQGYLSRIFKRQFNVSVMEYIHMRKINIAKSYFNFTDMSVTDVAFKLGYNESGYFGKVFKKYENTTIYKYKKGYENI